MDYSRGGMTFKEGYIGRLNVLRQTEVLPGEPLDVACGGVISLASQRERESGYVHARIDTFVQPKRWLYPEWPDYIKEGPATTKVIPTYTASADAGDGTRSPSLSDLGIGGRVEGAVVAKWYYDAVLRIYNEWYKWPEDPDETQIPVTPFVGLKLQNLPHYFTRLQQYDGLQAADYQLTTAEAGSRESIDVRDLAQLQARFSQAVDREWIGHNRYIELLREIYNAQGDREVDKVPMRVSQAEVGVNPQSRYATDGPSLGQAMSLYDFPVSHDVGTIVMPEHAIVTTCLAVRFAPIAENEVNPVAVVTGKTWEELVGHPEMLGAQQPRPVTVQKMTGTGAMDTLGYLPSGWEWRARWDCVGSAPDLRNSFPFIKNLETATSASGLRDATNIGEPFRSVALGHYLVNVMWQEDSFSSPVMGPRSSLYAGSGRTVRGGDYPYPGPRRVT